MGAGNRSLVESETHARRALEIDPSLPAAHAALAHSYRHQWRFREADKEFQSAIAADERSTIAQQLYALYLASAGRTDEAIQHGRGAFDLAPVSGLINYSLAQVYLQSGRYDDALEQAKRTVELDRHFPLAFQTLVRGNAQLGRIGDASEALDAEIRNAPEENVNVWRYLLAKRGRRDDAREVLRVEHARRKRPNSSIGEAAAVMEWKGNELQKIGKTTTPSRAGSRRSTDRWSV